MTDRAIKLVADNIDLTGVVRFNEKGGFALPDGKGSIDGSNITKINGGNIDTQTINASAFKGGTMTLTEAFSIVGSSKQENFSVDKEGNVTIKGTITMTGGSIKWGTDGVAAPTASQVGARPNTWVPAGSDMGLGELAYLSKITSTYIGQNSIQSGHIEAGAITASKIAANTITASQIDTDSIKAFNIEINNVKYYGTTGYKPRPFSVITCTGNPQTPNISIGDENAGSYWANELNIYGSNIKIGANSNAKIGFYSKTPIAKTTLSYSYLGSSATLAQVITRLDQLTTWLRNLGLVP